MDLKERISCDPSVLAGKPVIAGTRVTVEKILEHLSAGWTEEQIVQAHPFLSHEDVLACVSYALEVLRDWHLIPLATKSANSR